MLHAEGSENDHHPNLHTINTVMLKELPQAQWLWETECSLVPMWATHSGACCEYRSPHLSDALFGNCTKQFVIKLVTRSHLSSNLPVFLTQSTQGHEGPSSQNPHLFQKLHLSQVHRPYLTVVDKRILKNRDQISYQLQYCSFLFFSFKTRKVQVNGVPSLKRVEDQKSISLKLQATAQLKSLLNGYWLGNHK